MSKFIAYLSKQSSLLIEANSQEELYDALAALDSREMDNLTGNCKWRIDEIDPTKSNGPVHSALWKGMFLHPNNVPSSETQLRDELAKEKHRADFAERKLGPCGCHGCMTSGSCWGYAP